MNRNKAYLFSILFLVILLCYAVNPCYAAEVSDNDAAPCVVRIGWYDYDGFYNVDGNGYRSGYSYDYLQEIARYAGWSYEYIEGTVIECVKMLEEGKIDIIGAVMYSDEREKIMEFSSLALGKNYSVLTTRYDNMNYKLSDFSNFNEIKIGALAGDIRQAAFIQFASEKGFTYQLIEYDTTALMEKALKAEEVDAILTTNMRIASGDEKIIAQFSPVEFFFVTQKGNHEIMDVLNAAMEQIEFSRKGFQAELAQKYFSVDMSGLLTFTEEENRFIQTHPKIRVAFPALRKPLAYLDHGELKGIMVDIMNEIAERIGITFEYQSVDTQNDSIKKMNSEQIDIISNVYNDYGWAEMNNMFLSRPYMSIDYVSVALIGSNLNKENIKVAAVKGYRFSQDYIENQYKKEQIYWYNNEEECISAVSNGDCDVCFVSSYAASEYLLDYKNKNLYSSIINYTHGISAGVSKQNSKIILSLIDKAIASMGQYTIDNIIISNTMLQGRTLSINEMIMRYPIQFFGVFGGFAVIILTLLTALGITRNNRKKNEEIYHMRLAAEHDSLTGLYNRLAYEVLVTQELQEASEGLTGMFVMLDIDDFKQVNDKNGHSYGDKVLKTLAKGLQQIFGEQGVVFCRMGGDEFSVFFKNCPKPKEAVSLLTQGQKQLLEAKVDGISISCSIGTAFISETLMDFSTLYNAADKALYQAKNNGKGKVCVYQEDLD